MITQRQRQLPCMRACVYVVLSWLGSLRLQVPIKRIVALNKPELPAAVTGMLGSAALGMMMPGAPPGPHLAVVTSLAVYGALREPQLQRVLWFALILEHGCRALPSLPPQALPSPSAPSWIPSTAQASHRCVLVSNTRVGEVEEGRTLPVCAGPILWQLLPRLLCLTLRACASLCAALHACACAVEDISSGAQKWSLVFVAIGVGAIVAAMFQVRTAGLYRPARTAAWLANPALPFCLRAFSKPAVKRARARLPPHLGAERASSPSDPSRSSCFPPCPPTLQSYSFNYMGQKLALRVRVLMFRALLRQVCTCACAATRLHAHEGSGLVTGRGCTSGSSGMSTLCLPEAQQAAHQTPPGLLHACFFLPIRRRWGGTMRTATAAACCPPSSPPTPCRSRGSLETPWAC